MKKRLLYYSKFSPFITSTQTIYKRPLPPFLIQLNSEQGKSIFKEALMSGEMECFFSLIEQFTTQFRPSTCGTTTLTMVLNALGIDPKRTWQGIWRWYSEESLLCSHPDYLKEINIEQFAHLAKRNNASIHFFYHSVFNMVKNHSHNNKKEINIEKYDKNYVKALEKLKDETEESLLYMLERSTMSCPAGCTTPTSLINKSASFETFEDCVVATSRRDGFFLTCNSSRKALKQTGEGHFSPIGGYHYLRKMVLVLDVARYKYPPYWCNIKTFYDSLEPIDKATSKPRGFCLITKSYLNYASICRVTKDFKSLEGIKKWLGNVKVEKGKLAEVIEKMLANICEDFRFLFVFYLFELGNRIDPDQILHADKISSEEQKFGDNHLNSLVNSFRRSSTRLVIHEILDIFECGNKTNRVIKLVQDFHPYLQEELISLILMSLSDMLSQNNVHLKDFCADLKKDTMNSWNSAFEVGMLKKEIGIISEHESLDAFEIKKNI